MIYAIARVISLIFEIFSILIVVEVLGSFLTAFRVRLPNWAFDILQVIHRITGVVLDPIRRLVPALAGMDFSPLIALVLLDFLRRIILSALARL